MDETTAFELQIAAEVLRGAGPSEPVDDRAVFEAVTASSRARQRGFTMFSGLKFVGAGAIVAVLGGLLLTTSLTAPQTDTVTPAAVSDSPSPTVIEQRLVSGREVIDALMERGTPVTQWGYVTQHHGWVQTLSIAMDDPWVNGTGRWVSDVDIVGAKPDAVGNMRGGVSRDRGTLRIENEGGAWEGPCDSTSRDGGGHIVGSCVLTGSGGYEGYTYLHIHDWGVGGTTEGVIFAGAYGSAYPTLPPKPDHSPSA